MGRPSLFGCHFSSSAFSPATSTPAASSLSSATTDDPSPASPMLPLLVRSANSFASWSASSSKREDFTPPGLHEKKVLALPADTLPPPVSADANSSGRRSSRTKKNARVSGGLRVHWDRFVRKLGSGTAPSTSSNFEESVGDSSGYPRSRQEQPYPDAPDERVDEVVVDREWSDEIKSSSVTHSEHGGTPEKSGSNHLGGTNTDRDSFAVRPEGFWGAWGPLIYLRWRLWPLTHAFFCTRFMDEKSEMHYNKENWFLRKVSVSADPVASLFAVVVSVHL